MEVLRRLFVAILWIVGGAIAIGVTGNDTGFERAAGIAFCFAILFAFHTVINWIFAGAKKKAPENRGPLETEL